MGDKRAEIWSGLAAASCCQRARSRAPTTGTACSQAGGCGTERVATDLDQSAIRSAFSTMVSMAM